MDFSQGLPERVHNDRHANVISCIHASVRQRTSRIIPWRNSL